MLVSMPVAVEMPGKLLVVRSLSSGLSVRARPHLNHKTDSPATHGHQRHPVFLAKDYATSKLAIVRLAVVFTARYVANAGNNKMFSTLCT